jgi:hypothetical protein
MSLHEFKPSLDGCPLEVCLALSSGDYDPKVAAKHVYRCMNPIEWPTFRLLTNALFDLTQAAEEKDSGNVEAVLSLTDHAKALLRHVVVLWLKPRTCACCVALRKELEREQAHEPNLEAEENQSYRSGALQSAHA